MLDADLFDLVKTCLTSVLSLPADGVKKGTFMTLKNQTSITLSFLLVAAYFIRGYNYSLMRGLSKNSFVANMLFWSNNIFTSTT